MLGGPLGQPHGGMMMPDDKRARGRPNQEDLEEEESKKDFSHLLQVFSIYKGKESFNQSGFFNGGLDTGIDT